MSLESQKNYDLLLVHGLRNTHRWSRRFLNRCLSYWGSGRVYVLYLNPPLTTWERRLPSGTVICIGRNDFTAGTESVEVQAGYLAEKIEVLRQRYGLSRPFDVIAHSMGGLVARHYMAEHPDEVAALVTLGTPHRGTPMAADYRWLGVLLKARGAFENLTPEWLETFNETYRLDERGNVYTVRGYTRRGLNWGLFGELLMGYAHLTWRYRRRSDGLVPEDSSVIEGAVHAADLPGCNHIGLVRRPEVVDLCAAYLP